MIRATYFVVISEPDLCTKSGIKDKIRGTSVMTQGFFGGNYLLLFLGRTDKVTLAGRRLGSVE